MPRLTDSRVDELFREALDERADVLLHGVISREEMAARLERTVGEAPSRRQMALVLLAAALLIGLTLAAALGAGVIKLPMVSVASPSGIPTTSSATPSIPVATVPPDQLTVPGRLVLCDDLSWPPQAFTDAQGSPAGSDIGLVDAIGQRLDLQLQVVDARSNPDAAEAMLQGTCDLFAGMNIFEGDPLGAAGLSTIPYLGEGAGYVVRKGTADAFGTPANPRSSFLCGETIARVGTGDVAGDQIDRESTRDDCLSGGHPLTVVAFDTNEDALAALERGDVTAYFADLRVAGPDVAQASDQLELAHPEGLGFGAFATLSVAADKETLAAAIQAALRSVARDGTYDQILREWGLTSSAICPEDMQPNAWPRQTCLIPPAPSIAPTPSTPPLTVSAWRQVAPNPIANLGQPYGVAWSGARFVVAGSVIGPGFSHAHPNVQFWTSPDGQTWSLSPTASTGYPQAFAFDGSAGIAVGSDGNQAAVWTSPDSQTWTRLQNPSALTPSGQEAGMQLNHVAHGPAGYIALGELDIHSSQGDTGQALIVWSPDGQDWQRVPMGAFGDTEFTYLHDVVVVDGRYVIAGDQGGSPDAPGPTLWTSTDGRAWAAEPVLASRPLTFIELVAGPRGALLAGIKPGPLRSSQSCVLWGSSDGLTWTPRGDCPAGMQSPGLVATPFGFASSVQVLGSFCDGPCATPTPFPCSGGVEVSVTGARWTCVPPPPSGPLPPGDIVIASQNRIVYAGEGGISLADVQAPG